MSDFSQSAACCTIPPIDPNEVDYQPQGTFEVIAGLKTYVTGNRDAKHYLVALYDIFAFHPNTLRGADILGTSYLVLMSTSRPCLVLRVSSPQEGQVANWSWYPDDTPEKTEKLEGFLNGPGNTEKTVEKVMGVQKEAATTFKEVEKWGILVSYCSIPSTPFSAVVELHPGFVGKAVAEKICIPLLAICSKDETEEQADAFMKRLNPAIPSKHYVVFPEREHGWLSARGNLNNPQVLSDYEQGYRLMLEFFGKWL